LRHRLNEIDESVISTKTPERTFERAAVKYLDEYKNKRSIQRDIYALNRVMPFIGHLPLKQVHHNTLKKFKVQRLQEDEVAVGTVNKELAIVRRILNLAARLWRHDNGQPWLASAPLIEMEKGNARQPYPLEWGEQDKLFKELPAHLQRIALFAVNTGCRAQEICQLRWDWEVQVPELGVSIFVLPVNDQFRPKNGQERIVLLNKVARNVVEERRGEHPEFVFDYRGRPLAKLSNSGWRRARERAGLEQVRVHDLRHTFGHRLRCAGVNEEDRQDLLGHKSDSITTHYSAPEVGRLLESVEKICDRRPDTVLRVALT
jgi:integrase